MGRGLFLFFQQPQVGIFARMNFDAVIGQEATKQQLRDLVDGNRLSHALLFLGREGAGGLPMALAFSTYLIGALEKKKHAGNSLFGEAAPSSDSMGEAQARQYIHPDIHYSYPVVPRKPGDKPLSSDYGSEWREFIKLYPYGNVYDWLQFINAENRQGNISVAECNDIIRKLNLKSFESEYKVLVMWMPEYLGKEGNKLLKLIEEPPPNTLFILVAENEQNILPTILSRCQLVKIPALSYSEVAHALVSRANLAEDKARQLALLSDGNYREALQLLQHAEEDWQQLLREWLNAILKSGPGAQLKWIEEVAKLGREKQKQFLRYFTHLLEQSIRLRLLPGIDLPIAPQETDFATRLNRLADLSQQKAIIEELDKAAYHIERNANAKILFHALTIRVYHIIRDKALILAD
jgi:DNA polymerase III subunit delta'